jgi:polysaccharide biosynthesis/export protein
VTRNLAIGLLLVFSSVPAFAQQAAAPAPAKTEAGDQFVIGLEDVLSVVVWKEPELSVKEVVVRPDGQISLPLVNDIRASGMTPRQLQDAIADKLKEFVASPNVTVTVIKIMSQTVSLVGEVAKPGIYTLGSPMTVLDLLARSGGFREGAKLKKIKIVRKGEGGATEQFTFNYKDVSSGKNLSQNIPLKNGDVVIVP